MRSVRLAVAALVAALFTLPAGAHAQANKAQLYHFTPKQGAAAEFEEALAAHAEWRRQNGDPWGWEIYEVVQGKNVGDFIVRSGGHDWSDWDSYAQGFGPRGAERFNANVAPHVAGQKAYVEAVDTAVVRWPEDAEGYRLYQVDTYHLKPGAGEDWYGAVQQVHDAIVQEEAAGFYHSVSYPVAGSSGWARLVFPYQSWADFEQPDPTLEEVLSAAHSEEEVQQIFDSFSDAYQSMHSMVVRYRPDLSVEGSGSDM